MNIPNSHEDCLFFWGHTPKNHNVIDKSCLSQWYPSQFRFSGTSYDNAEQFMMHMKALLFNDQLVADMIMKATTPKEMKTLGRQVRNFNEKEWDSLKDIIVKRATIEKFRQNPKLLGFLISTSGKYLVEASPYDTIWGIGLDEEDAREIPIPEWKGQNLLGKILTEVRDEFLDNINSK
ncbi:MAG TPA: NADAR family protein [Methanosarcina sp.]|nr:NADAR family protein [Methanosarcina sp.]